MTDDLVALSVDYELCLLIMSFVC